MKISKDNVWLSQRKDCETRKNQRPKKNNSHAPNTIHSTIQKLTHSSSISLFLILFTLLWRLNQHQIAGAMESIAVNSNAEFIHLFSNSSLSIYY